MNALIVLHEQSSSLSLDGRRKSEKKQEGFDVNGSEVISWPVLRSARKRVFFFFSMTNLF